MSALGDNSKELTDSSSEVTIEALKSLKDQLTNTNKITSTLMDTTNESLQKSKEHIGDSVGNISQVASTLTNAALQSFQFGTTLFSSIITVIKTPFESVKGKIDSIKASNDSPKGKFEAIKKEITNNFNNNITPTLQNNFNNQLIGLINNVDELIQLYKKLGCKVFMWQYNCPPEIQMKIDAILKIKIDMESKKNNFLLEINGLFGQFTSRIALVSALGLTKDNLEEKIQEMETEIQKIQNDIITQVTAKLQGIIKDFDHKLELIKGNIDELSRSMTSILSIPQKTDGGRRHGGRRRKYKTKRNKKNKTSKSKKRNRIRNR